MSTMTTQIRGGLTRLQVGAAACAVVAAAALPAVVANAETRVPAPIAPVQILMDAPLVPLSPVMNIAEQTEWTEWLENNRIDSFRALVFAVVDRVDGSPFLSAILPPYTDLGRVIFDAILGPYGTLRN